MKRAVVLLVLVVILVGCNGATATAGPPAIETVAGGVVEPATATPTSTATVVDAPTATPTPTPAAVLVAATNTAEPPAPTGGRLGIRIVDPMAGDEDCLAEIPYAVVREGDRFMVDGAGPVDCEFINVLEGVTHNHIYDIDVTLMGEILMGIANQPKGAFHVEMWLDGEMVQYFTDYPPDAMVLYTEDAPFKSPPQDASYLLVVPYEEGATLYLTQAGVVEDPGGAVAAWTLTLHPGQ